MEADSEAIRRAREEAGLTQAELGAPILTRQAVSSIEAGRVRPSARSLGHIANRLNLPVEALLRKGGPTPELRVTELRRLCEAREYGEALRRANVLLRLRTADPPLMAGAHHFAGIALYHQHNYADAATHLGTARVYAEQVPDPRLAAESLDWQAAARFSLDDPAALGMARDALALYRRLSPRRTDVEARMLERLATVLERRGAYEEAERLYGEALELQGVVQHIARAGHLYHGLALISADAGDLGRSIELMQRAIGFYLITDDVALARAYNDLAVFLTQARALPEADALLISAFARLKRIGPTSDNMRASVLETASRLRQEQGKMREAIDFAQQAIDLSRMLGLPRPHAEGLMQLGNLHEASGHPRLADRSYRDAIDVLHAADETELERRTRQAFRRMREDRRRRRTVAS